MHPDMKKLLFFLLILTCIQCKQKEVVTTGPHSFVQSTQPVAAAEPTASTQADSLVFSYERTACFGQCPIYKIHVYESGYATYEGINFVDRIGKYNQYIDPSIVRYIREEADKLGFFSLQDQYKNDASDFPAMITFIRSGNRKKLVRNESMGPQALTDLQKTIERSFSEVQWNPVLK